MSLDTFLGKLNPLLLERLGDEEAARTLAVREGESMDARQLAALDRARRPRRDAVESVFARTHGAVLTRAGDLFWAELVEVALGSRRPPADVLQARGGALVEAIAGRPERLPGAEWIAELADLEWHRHLVAAAAPEPPPDEPRVRVSPTASLRRHRHDLVGWLRGSGTGDPARAEFAVLIFRQPGREPGGTVQIAAAAIEVVALLERAAREDATEPSILDGAEADGLERETLTRALAALRAAGVIIG